MKIKPFNLFIDDPNKTQDTPPGGPKVEDPKGLKDIIKDAAASIQKEEEPKKEEKKEEIKKEEPKKEEVKVDEDELTEEQQKFVKNLYKGLNNSDPKIQIATLKLLANAAGMDLAEIKTEKQAEKAEETLLDLLKNGLGEYDFLAEKLAPVLDKALDKLVEAKTKDIREEFKADKEAKQLESIQSSIQSTVDKYTNATELIPDLSKLMEQFKPSAKVSPEDYFNSLLVLAANNKNITLKLVESKVTDDKVKKNRNDANGRLASERNAEVKETTRIPGRMSLKESVQDAAEKAAELMNQKG